MNFERLAFQCWIENTLGCENLEDWSSFKGRLEGFSLGVEYKSEVESLVRKDATSFFQRGLISFSSAYEDFRRGDGGWGIVKLYYSLFYSLRSRLFFRNQAMIRNRCWFHFDINFNAGAVSARRLSGDRYRNDHEASINLYEDIFGLSDILLSNKISEIPPLKWMMDLRNISNYRMARFSDPDFPNDVLSIINRASIDALIDSNIHDTDNRLAFQPEHAWIALPMKHLVAAAEDMRSCSSVIMAGSNQVTQLSRKIDVLPEILRARLGSIAIATHDGLE